MLIVGVVSIFRIKGNDDFFIGGRRAGSLIIAGSLTATILGSSAVLGTANMAYDTGFSAMWWLLCAFIGLLILVPLSVRVRRYGRYSFPELIGHFYGRQAFFISSVIIPVAWIGVISAQVTGSAKVLNSFLGMDYGLGVVLSGFLFMVYTFAGGQVAILKTDIIQAFIIITGILYLFVHIFFFGQGNALEGLGQSFPFSEGFGWFELAVLLLTLSTTYFVGPDIYSRLFCARDERAARTAVVITALAVLVMAFVIVYTGVYACTIMDIDTKSRTVLVDLSMVILPEWAIGLMTAALLSAIMSSADTTLLTASTIISEIFCLKDRGRFIVLTRVFIILLGLVSIFFALYVRNIISSLLTALTIFSGSFVIPSVAGLLGYRAGRSRVGRAIILGGITALAGRVIQMSGMGNTGDIIVISAFLMNALILFFPGRNINYNEHKTEQNRST